MKLVALCVAITIAASPAMAVVKPEHHKFKMHKVKVPKPTTVQSPLTAVRSGQTMTAVGTYAGFATGCAALSLWWNAAVKTSVGQGELTITEAHAMAADCFLPFIGGWMVRRWHANNPQWFRK